MDLREEGCSKGSKVGGGGGGEDELCGKCSLAVEKRCVEIDKRFLAMEKRFLDMERLALTVEMRSSQFPMVSKGYEDLSRRLFFLAMDTERIKTALHELGAANVQPVFMQQQEGSQQSQQCEQEQQQNGGSSQTDNQHEQEEEEEQRQQSILKMVSVSNNSPGLSTDGYVSMLVVDDKNGSSRAGRDKIGSQSEERKARKSSTPKKRITVKQEPSLYCKISDFEFESLEIPQMMTDDASISVNTTVQKIQSQDNEKIVGREAGCQDVQANSGSTGPAKDSGTPTVRNVDSGEVISDSESVKSKNVRRGVDEEDAMKQKAEKAAKKKRNEVITQWKINAVKPGGSQDMEVEEMEQQNHPLDFSKGRCGKSDDRDSGTAEMSPRPIESYPNNYGLSRVETVVRDIIDAKMKKARQSSYVQKAKVKPKANKFLTKNDSKTNGKCPGKTGRPKLDDPRERKYCCNFCGNKYLTKCGLFDHFKRAHQIAGSLHHKILDGSLKQGVGAIIKPHPCHNCGDNFTGSQDLAYHKMFRKCHSKGYVRTSNVSNGSRLSQESNERDVLKPEYSNDLHTTIKMMKDIHFFPKKSAIVL